MWSVESACILDCTGFSPNRAAFQRLSYGKIDEWRSTLFKHDIIGTEGLFRGISGSRFYTGAMISKLRQVQVQKVVDQYAGGTQSQAAVVKIDGESKFLKSQRPHHYARYANFESEILAHDLFEVAGIRSPEAEVVRLKPGTPLHKELGSVVLAMDFVDSEFAGHRKVAHGAWGLRDGADKTDYLKMTLVDIVMGNADRRDANYLDRWTSSGRVKPVPIDNNSGFGNLINWKIPTNHCNFVCSYDGAGDTPGLRQDGTIANILLDTMLHREILDEPHEQQQALDLAKEFVQALSDEKIEAMVEELPREIIPRGTKVNIEKLNQSLSPSTLSVLLNGASPEVSGQELFQLRKQQIKDTLAWRRDHLVEALQKFFAADQPVQQASEDWKLLGQS